MKKFAKISFLFLFTFGVFLGPVSAVWAQTEPPVTQVQLGDTNADYTNRLQNCIFGGEGGTFAGCLVQGAYLILQLSGKFAEYSGKLLDIFIAYSLDSNSYAEANGDFVNQGWGVIRDIANVAFIFTLLYIAIRHILQTGSSDTKKLLTSLIVAALLINFSLFFSKVIIDGGNILARAFYNNIEIANDDYTGGEGVKTISQALVAKVNPQVILGSDLFKPEQAPGVQAGTMTIGYSFFVIALATFVNVTIGIVFLSTFLLFAARVIGLWFLMIFSPLAFVSLALPGGGSFLGQFGWSGWIKNIMKLSFMAPVFLFFLFLLVMFLSIVTSESIVAGTTDTTHRIMGVLIPFIAIVVILQRAKSIAGDMAGEFGEGLTSAVGKVLGKTLAIGGAGAGLALGGAAYLGRSTIGAGASERLASGKNQENVRRYNLMAQDSSNKARLATSEAERRQHESDARKARRMASWNASKVKRDSYLKEKATFDVRRSTMLQKAGGAVNSGLENVSKGAVGEKLKLDFGKGSEKTQGKYEKEVSKERLATAQLYSTEKGQADGNKTLGSIKDAAEKGLGSKDEILTNIDKYMREIIDSYHFSDSEKEEKLKNAKLWQEAVNSAQTDKDIKDINQGGEVVVNVIGSDGKPNGETKIIKFEAPGSSTKVIQSERESFADQTGYSNIIGLKLREKAKEKLMNSIRKGDKPDSTKDMIAKLAKEAGIKVDDGHGKEKDDHGGGKGGKDDHAHPPAPKPAAPAPSAPSGGGGGGGGGGHAPGH
jgi:hypothetical protein